MVSPELLVAVNQMLAKPVPIPQLLVKLKGREKQEFLNILANRQLISGIRRNIGKSSYETNIGGKVDPLASTAVASNPNALVQRYQEHSLAGRASGTPAVVADLKFRIQHAEGLDPRGENIPPESGVKTNSHPSWRHVTIHTEDGKQHRINQIKPDVVWSSVDNKLSTFSTNKVYTHKSVHEALHNTENHLNHNGQKPLHTSIDADHGSYSITHYGNQYHVGFHQTRYKAPKIIGKTRKYSEATEVAANHSASMHDLPDYELPYSDQERRDLHMKSLTVLQQITDIMNKRFAFIEKAGIACNTPDSGYSDVSETVSSRKKVERGEYNEPLDEKKNMKKGFTAAINILKGNLDEFFRNEKTAKTNKPSTHYETPDEEDKAWGRGKYTKQRIKPSYQEPHPYQPGLHSNVEAGTDEDKARLRKYGVRIPGGAAASLNEPLNWKDMTPANDRERGFSTHVAKVSHGEYNRFSSNSGKHQLQYHAKGNNSIFIHPSKPTGRFESLDDVNEAAQNHHIEQMKNLKESNQQTSKSMKKSSFAKAINILQKSHMGPVHTHGANVIKSDQKKKDLEELEEEVGKDLDGDKEKGESKEHKEKVLGKGNNIPEAMRGVHWATSEGDMRQQNRSSMNDYANPRIIPAAKAGVQSALNTGIQAQVAESSLRVKQNLPQSTERYNPRTNEGMVGIPRFNSGITKSVWESAQDMLLGRYPNKPAPALVNPYSQQRPDDSVEKSLNEQREQLRTQGVNWHTGHLA